MLAEHVVGNAERAAQARVLRAVRCDRRENLDRALGVPRLDEHQRVTKQGVGVPSVELQRATITLLRLVVSQQLPEAGAQRTEWLTRFRFAPLGQVSAAPRVG